MISPGLLSTKEFIDRKKYAKSRTGLEIENKLEYDNEL